MDFFPFTNCDQSSMALGPRTISQRSTATFARGFAILALLLPLASTLAAATRPVQLTIEGTIQSSGIQHLQDVKIVIPTPKFETKVPAGSFKITISDPGKTHFQCEVSASGFKKLRLTVVVRHHTASLGLIRLQPYIELSSMTVTPTEEGTTKVDFVIENKLPSSLIIQRIELSAPTPLSAVESGPCFAGPMLILHFRRNAVVTHTVTPRRFLKLKLDIVPKLAADSAELGLIVNGEIIASCGDTPRLLLAAPYPFSINPHDQQKIRIEVPQHLTLSWDEPADGPTVKDLTPDWSHAMAGVYLQGGDQIVVEPD